MHLLIPYVYLRKHADPMFTEFTYGDHGVRARRMKSDLHKGDYVFFHTSQKGKKYITAYYIVDRVLDTKDACKDKLIYLRYKNPHIIEGCVNKRSVSGDDDAIVFGDPITSHIFERPLLFDRRLAEKLSLGINFKTKRTETQAIGSATRQWRKLKKKDIKILLKEIERAQNKDVQKTLRSTEEVAESLEKDIEDFIARNTNLIGKDLTLAERQFPMDSGRIDLLFEHVNGSLVVVEVKMNKIGRNAVQQINRYIKELKAREPRKKINGVLVCAGVMPAYEDELRKQKDVRILLYGWDVTIQPWQ